MSTTAETTPVPQPPRARSSFRIVKWLLLLIVLIVVIAGAAVYMNLNRIVKRVVVKQSSDSLNVPTQLRSANVSLFSGNVTLHQFDVGSPQGFNAPQMMSLGEIAVDTSLGELRSDPVRVSSINIRHPRLVIEMQGANFNIKKFADSLPAAEAKSASPNEKPLKLIINDFKVDGAQVIFRPDMSALASIPGLDKASIKPEYVLNIPPLDLQNIGTGEGNQNGAALKDIVTLLVTQLAAKATQSEQLPPEIRALLSMNVDQMTDMVKAKIGAEVNKQIEKVKGDITRQIGGEAGKVLGGVMQNPQQAATNPTQAIEQGLGGLIGGATKDKQKKKPATQPR